MAAELSFFNIPWDVLDASKGFSLDMGGSIIKLVYIDKKEWLEPAKKEKNSTGKLHLRSFSYDDFSNGTVYKFMKEHVLMKPGKDNKPPIVYGTGMFASTNGKEIDKELNIRMQVLPETDAFISTLSYAVKYLTRGDIVVKLPDEDIKVAHSLMETTKTMYTNAGGSSKILKFDTAKEIAIDPHFEEGSSSEPFSKDPDMYPYMIVLCGSGSGSLCIYEDGKYKFTSISHRAGKTWLGVGSMLSGAENYETLMQLAEKGSVLDVDMTYTDFTPPEETRLENEDDIYQKNNDIINTLADIEPVTAFSFGKAVQKTVDDFKKEDLAKTYLRALTSDMVSHVIAAAMHEKVKHIFFSGGFVSHPIVRRSIYIQLMNSGFSRRLLNGDVKPFQCHFLKGGQHYGAIGALLNHKLKYFKSKTEE